MQLSLPNIPQTAARLLIVDDDVAFRNVLSEILKSHGYPIFTAKDCKEAVALATSHDFDLALLDINLPDGSGLALSSELGTIPVLFITQYDEQAAIDKAIATGRSGQNIVGYLTKPLDFTTIEPTIRVSVALARSLTERARLHKAAAHVIEQQKRRLAREIHDELGQTLVGVRWEAMAIQNALSDDDAHLDAVRRAENILEHVRALQEGVHRIIEDLHPEVLDTRGLAEALSALIDGWNQRIPDCHFLLRCGDKAGINQLDIDYASIVYRVVQESLTNIVKHANANTVEVMLEIKPGYTTTIHGSISDNGVGFEPASVRPERHGLMGMHERILSLGGVLHVDSQPAQGTRITFTIPLLPRENSV